MFRLKFEKTEESGRQSIIESVYSKESDLTFLMERVINEDGDMISEAVIGFHHGEPSPTVTPIFINNTVAYFI